MRSPRRRCAAYFQRTAPWFRAPLCVPGDRYSEYEMRSSPPSLRRLLPAYLPRTSRCTVCCSDVPRVFGRQTMRFLHRQHASLVGLHPWVLPKHRYGSPLQPPSLVTGCSALSTFFQLGSLKGQPSRLAVSRARRRRTCLLLQKKGPAAKNDSPPPRQAFLLFHELHHGTSQGTRGQV